MYNVLGSCSICGGDVIVPAIWNGTTPPEPQCASCGAVKKAASKKIIEMIAPTNPQLLQEGN